VTIRVSWADVTAAELPTIVEVKRTLAGVEKRFDCRVLSRAPGHLAVLWIAPAAMQVHGIDLPAGTVSVGHFWTDRPYNVYHWLRADRSLSTIGYYFNLADETRWTADRLDWRDLTVDVLATPEGRLDVLDEDELPPDLDAEARAHIDAGKAALLGATAAVLAEVEAASRGVLPLAAFALELA
jgi:predicted RNA-binding protein associated with RNAse of E/G family